ncbi:uncharacterized protein LY89DRAFT_711717 [Mollisia scopiformis]|uniref:Uncharacterized protein n=1 Tax=Mollisia scopiformis TaxID=149040 RepID=A0A132B8I0_MOLSC|nr:uncharacterized protein LY89DRAFT_711717 [Mollisia scopiformis]KUJ08299.1 hypothetical protein LY89DRAFT_711717 [Mollisia scopiformis]
MHQSVFVALAWSLAAATQVATELSVRIVYQFASNDTWLENIAVRSNGIILTTEIGPPARLLAFNANEANPEKQVLVTSDTVLGLSGISEGAHDVFYVTGANTTSDNIEDPPTNATYVWEVDFTQNATLPAMEDDLIIDINGIKVKDGYLAKLYSNVTAGVGKVIVNASPLDDFVIAPDGFRLNTTLGNSTKYAYAATAAENSILQISFNKAGGTNQTAIVAGDVDSTEIAEPTGTAFGRGEGQLNKLYVATGGGSGVNVDADGVETAVGAQLLEIQLS